MKTWLTGIVPLHAGKIIFLLSVTSFFFMGASAQAAHSRRKEDFDIYKFGTTIINLNNHSAIALQLNHIQDITVADARADTSNIGFMQKKLVDPVSGLLSNAAKNQSELRINRRPAFVVLEQGLTAATRKYLSRSVLFPHPSLSSSSPGVLMVIKKLWLSDELNLDRPEQRNGGKLSGPLSKDLWTSGIDVAIEFYLKDQEAYYPLYRYDTVISKATTISEYGPEFIEQALQLSIRKLLQTDAGIASVSSKKKFSLEEINRHNALAFDMPVLKDSALRSGVYMTFEEFKNNQPSQTGFELNRDKLTDILFIRQPDGKEWVARNVWGYSDGENAFVKAGDNFFLLQRKEKAFYVFGAKNLKRTDTSSGNTAAYAGNTGFATPVYYTSLRAGLQLEPFQLDWATGLLY